MRLLRVCIVYMFWIIGALIKSDTLLLIAGLSPFLLFVICVLIKKIDKVASNIGVFFSFIGAFTLEIYLGHSWYSYILDSFYFSKRSYIVLVFIGSSIVFPIIYHFIERTVMHKLIRLKKI